MLSNSASRTRKTITPQKAITLIVTPSDSSQYISADDEEMQLNTIMESSYNKKAFS